MKLNNFLNKIDGNENKYFYFLLSACLLLIICIFPPGYVLARLYYDPFYYLQAGHSFYSTGSLKFEVVSGYGFVNYPLLNGLIYSPIYFFKSVANQIIASQIINICEYIVFIYILFSYIGVKKYNYIFMLFILSFTLIDYKYNHAIIFANADFIPASLTLISIKLINNLWKSKFDINFLEYFILLVIISIFGSLLKLSLILYINISFFIILIKVKKLQYKILLSLVMLFFYITFLILFWDEINKWLIGELFFRYFIGTEIGFLDNILNIIYYFISTTVVNLFIPFINDPNKLPNNIFYFFFGLSLSYLLLKVIIWDYKNQIFFYISLVISSIFFSIVWDSTARYLIPFQFVIIYKTLNYLGINGKYLLSNFNKYLIITVYLIFILSIFIYRYPSYQKIKYVSENYIKLYDYINSGTFPYNVILYHNPPVTNIFLKLSDKVNLIDINQINLVDKKYLIIPCFYKTCENPGELANKFLADNNIFKNLRVVKTFVNPYSTVIIYQF